MLGYNTIHVINMIHVNNQKKHSECANLRQAIILKFTIWHFLLVVLWKWFAHICIQTCVGHDKTLTFYSHVTSPKVPFILQISNLLQTSLSRSSSSSRRSRALAWMSINMLTISCWRPIRGDQLRPLRFTKASIVSSSLSIIRFWDDSSFRRICRTIKLQILQMNHYHYHQNYHYVSQLF